MHAAVLSSFFEAWVRKNGGTMGQATMTLSLSAGVKSFPLPSSVTGAIELVTNWENAFNELSKRVGTAFTKIINAFNSTDDNCEDVLLLRKVRSNIDSVLSNAFGWNDIDLGHGFHETKQGVRYTISEPARREVLARLLKLNHERYAEEVAQGLHDKKKSSAKKAGRTRSSRKTTWSGATLARSQAIR